MRNATLSNPINQPTSSKQVGYRVNGGRFQCTTCVVDKYEAPDRDDGDLINEQGDTFVPMLVADLDGQGCLECGAFGMAAMIDVIQAMLAQALDPNGGGGIELDTAANAAKTIGVDA